MKKLSDKERRTNMHATISVAANDLIRAIAEKHGSNAGRVIDYLACLYADKLLNDKESFKPLLVKLTQGKGKAEKPVNQNSGNMPGNDKGLTSFF